MALDSTLPLGFGLVSLLALQLILVRGSSPKRVAVGLFGGGLAVGLMAVGWWLAPPRYLPNAPSSGLAVALAEDIRKGLSDEEPVRFLILDGGSYSARGVDDAILEVELTEGLGTPVEVLALSLAGGNQLERWTVLRRAMDLLDRDERARFDAAPKLLLLEMHAQYDRYPLIQFENNRYSDRAFAYLDAAVFGEVLRAEHGIPRSQAGIAQWIDVSAHVAANVMNVGLASRVVPIEAVGRRGGYVPLDRAASDFRFRGTKAVRKSLEQATLPADEFPWRNIELRRERYRKVLGEMPEVVYFSVPTARVYDLEYANGFCSTAGYPCVTHGHWGLLQRLDAEEFWYDTTHLRERGAKVYTRWLSRQLAPILEEWAQP